MKFGYLVASLGTLLFASSIVAISSRKDICIHYSYNNLNISKKNKEINNANDKISLESQDAKFEVIN